MPSHPSRIHRTTINLLFTLFTNATSDITIDQGSLLLVFQVWIHAHCLILFFTERRKANAENRQNHVIIETGNLLIETIAFRGVLFSKSF